MDQNYLHKYSKLPDYTYSGNDQISLLVREALLILSSSIRRRISLEAKVVATPKMVDIAPTTAPVKLRPKKVMSIPAVDIKLACV